jgi:TPP-dependent pyruvate/acetoin dehydrogenase alpha subunit
VNLAEIYRQMARMRAVEEALGQLWGEGLISGEMHLGVGEEAIATGTIAHLRDGDSMSLDYRPTPALVARGVDVTSIIAEALGSEQGLCRGHGGHMHLYSPEHLATSTGIVGSSAPLAAGLSLAGRRLRPGSVTLAFFGDGAVNQGMVMESLNLAAVWKLPVVFVCKDNGWAVTTRSSRLTGGTLAGRARSFGMPAWVVDGRDVTKVWKTAGRAIDRARRGAGPSFIVARCRRPRGHFEDDPLVRAVRHPSELWSLLPELTAGAKGSRTGLGGRLSALGQFIRTLLRVAFDQWFARWDPLPRVAKALSEETVSRIEVEVAAEVDEAVDRALVGASR